MSRKGIATKLQPYAILGDINLTKYPNLVTQIQESKFDIQIKPEKIPLPDILKDTTDYRVVELFGTQGHAVLYVSFIIHNDKSAFSKADKAPDKKTELPILKFYINCYLACMPEELFAITIKRLASVMESGHALLSNLSKTDGSECAKNKISADQHVFYGFFGINSIVKKSYGK